MKLWFVLGVVALTLVPACGGDDDGSGGSSGTGAASGGGAGGSGGATGGTSSGGAAGSSTGGTPSTGGAAGSGGTSATGGAAGAGGTSAGGAAGAGGTSSGGTGGTGGTAACNTLVNDGPNVPESAETGTAPTMTGGTISDGTYVLSARKDWQGSCNCNTRQKLSISGTALQVVTQTDSAPEQHLTATIAATGNKLTLSVTCPAAQTLSLEYTASATELQIFDPKDQSLQIFTKK